MILGSSRIPFSRPAAASPNFTPSPPSTGWYSHLNPFSQVMTRMPATPAYMPGFAPYEGPHALPAVPMPAPAAPTAVAAAAGGMKGAFGGAGFGSTGGVKPHGHFNAYATMRSGWMASGVMPSGRNIRGGVRNASSRIHSMMPFQTAPLSVINSQPVLPTAPGVPAPGPVAGAFGFGLVSGRKRARKRRWWQLFPPSTQEQAVAETEQCETYAPTVEGIRRTVCNGRVTKYEDAQGNVSYPGQIPAGLGAIPQHWVPEPQPAYVPPQQPAWRPQHHHRRHPGMRPGMFSPGGFRPQPHGWRF